MDDVDAVQAQIARTMLESGDWVTARLDGVAYLEKSPLIYWMMAASFRIFGVHDWAARLPLALAAVVLCWVVYRFGKWGLGERAGVFGGVILATAVGLYLFTRIQIPDATLTLMITLAIWAWMRLLEPDEVRPKLWAFLLGFALSCGLLLKGLIAIVFPIGAGFLYMLVAGQLWSPSAWSKLRLWIVIPLMLIIAAPWHVFATLRNPPYFAFTMHSGPGEYHGFFWFYFINEHLLRFLNLRYPRDYNTVPRLLFWLLNLVWLFPWSVYLPGVVKLGYGRSTRAERTRRMAVCWIIVVMLFFTFSTTQEYYSMPIYPALALLVGSALAEERFFTAGCRIKIAIFALLTVGLGTILWLSAGIPAQGELVDALDQHPEMYTLSMGHMGDLTLAAFAYLRLPLAVAVAACGITAVGIWISRKSVVRTVAVTAFGMALFYQASRLALIRFDAYLGSYPLAQALLHSPSGTLIEADAYYSFSSVFFYTNRSALLLDGRNNNLEYGSYAPNAPAVFIDDTDFARRWRSPNRYYLLANNEDLRHLQNVLGSTQMYLVKGSSGKSLLKNF